MKKQIASLLSERDELSAELDDLEALHTTVKKEASAAKKSCKQHLQELEDVKQQLAAAQQAGGAGKSSSSSVRALARSSSSSSSSSSLDEQQLREEVSLLQLRLEDLAISSEEKLSSSRRLVASLTSQLSSLRVESESLRSRALKFDALSVLPSHIDPKKNAKDKLQLDLISAYETVVKRERFLENQLKECDQTLSNAKNGWQATIGMLQEQVQLLETEVAEYKRAATSEVETRLPFDQQQFDLIEKKLRKSEAARAKLAEVASSLESEILKKKAELATAHQSLIALQGENKRVKEELVRSGLALKTIADDNFEVQRTENNSNSCGASRHRQQFSRVLTWTVCLLRIFVLVLS